MSLEKAFEEPTVEPTHHIRGILRKAGYAIPIYGEMTSFADTMEAAKRGGLDIVSRAVLTGAFHVAKYALYWKAAKTIIENPSVQHLINDLGKNMSTLSNSLFYH